MISTLNKEKYLRCGLCELYEGHKEISLGCFHYDHDTALYVCHSCGHLLWWAEQWLNGHKMHDPSKSVNMPKGRGVDSNKTPGV